MSDDSVRFSAPLEEWTNEAETSSVAFATLTADAAEQLGAHELARRLELGKRRGFGSVRLTVRVGGSERQTSAFPMKGCSWFLPIKAAICRAEGLAEGDCIEVELDLH